jgi:hypothetical protein
MGIIFWSIDVRWLSDRMVSVTACIGNDLEYANAVLQPLGWAKTGVFLARQRLHQTVGTDDFHDPFQVVGEHTQAHLGAHPCELSGQEVRRPHPLFERPEGMLNSSFSDSHHLRRVAQPVLHFFQYRFMFPAPNSSFRARCALRFQGAALAFRTPVTV